MRYASIFFLTMGIILNTSAQLDDKCGNIRIPKIETQGCESGSVLDSIISSSWDVANQQYEKKRTTIYSYDSIDRFLNYKLYHSNNSEPIYQYAQSYDSTQKLSTIEHYQTYDDELFRDQIIEITYDHLGRITTLENFSFDPHNPGDTSIFAKCTCHDFNDNNDPRLKEFYLNKVFQERILYEYDKNNKITSKKIYFWDPETSSHDLLYRYAEYDYDKENLVSCSNYEYDFDLDEFYIYNKQSFEYDGNNNLITYLHQIDKYNGLVNSFKHEYTYNECGSKAQKSYSSFDTDDQEWKEQYISTYHYSDLKGE